MRFKGCFFKGLLVALILTLLPGTAFSAQKITPGSVCKVYKQKVTYQNKVFTCIKSGKKLVWNKGVAVKKPTPTPTPTPTISCTDLKTLPTPIIKKLDLDVKAKRYTATILIPKIDENCDKTNKIYFDFTGNDGGLICSNPRIEITKTPVEIICPNLVQQSTWRMYLTTYSESLKTFLLSEDVTLKTPPIVNQPVTPEPRPTDKSKLPYVSVNSFCDENYAGKWARTSSEQLLVCNTVPDLGIYAWTWRFP
jgi:hypothetical protein